MMPDIKFLKLTIKISFGICMQRRKHTEIIYLSFESFLKGLKQGFPSVGPKPNTFAPPSYCRTEIVKRKSNSPFKPKKGRDYTF